MDLLSDLGGMPHSDVRFFPVQVLQMRRRSTVAQGRLVETLKVFILNADHVTS